MSSVYAVVVFVICFAVIEGRAFNEQNRHKRQSGRNSTSSYAVFTSPIFTTGTPYTGSGSRYTGSGSRYNSTATISYTPTPSSNSTGSNYTGSGSRYTGSGSSYTGSGSSYNSTATISYATTQSSNFTGSNSTGSISNGSQAARNNQANCNVVVSGEGKGHLASPPQGYWNNMHCTYIIVTPTPVDLHITMNTFSIEYEAACGYDSLSFGKEKHCGQLIPKELVFRSNGQFVITLDTDYSVTDAGFDLDFYSTPVQ